MQKKNKKNTTKNVKTTRKGQGNSFVVQGTTKPIKNGCITLTREGLLALAGILVELSRANIAPAMVDTPQPRRQTMARQVMA